MLLEHVLGGTEEDKKSSLFASFIDSVSPDLAFVSEENLAFALRKLYFCVFRKFSVECTKSTRYFGN
jgi:hypothetical protein